MESTLTDDVDDPKKGVAFANEMIRKYRKHSEEARLAGDTALASKYDFYLTKWADILQHFIHEVRSAGMDKTDLGDTVRKRNKVRLTG